MSKVTLFLLVLILSGVFYAGKRYEATNTAELQKSYAESALRQEREHQKEVDHLHNANTAAVTALRLKEKEFEEEFRNTTASYHSSIDRMRKSFDEAMRTNTPPSSTSGLTDGGSERYFLAAVGERALELMPEAEELRKRSLLCKAYAETIESLYYGN